MKLCRRQAAHPHSNHSSNGRGVGDTMGGRQFRKMEAFTMFLCPVSDTCEKQIAESEQNIVSEQIQLPDDGQ